MHNGARSLLLAAMLAAFACGGGTDIDTQPTSPEKKEVVNQSTGLKVSATIAAATLGSSYANVQIAFFASDATSAAAVQIVSAELVDESSGAIDAVYSASNPQVWNGRSYETWNEKVTPGGDLKASYQLKDNADPTGRGSTISYKATYRLKLTLRIDGADMTIESGQLQREPEVAT